MSINLVFALKLAAIVAALVWIARGSRRSRSGTGVGRDEPPARP